MRTKVVASCLSKCDRLRNSGPEPRKAGHDGDQSNSTLCRMPVASQLAWLTILQPSTLDEAEWQRLHQLQAHLQVAHAYSLTHQFSHIVRDRSPDELVQVRMIAAT